MTVGDCYEGYYCPEAKENGDKVYNKWPKSRNYGCNVGEFCAAGAFEAKACPEGYYQPNKLQGSCLKCPSGHECNSVGGASRLPLLSAGLEGDDEYDFRCPKGYWCEEGTSMAANACPEGTYQPIERAKSRD